MEEIIFAAVLGFVLPFLILVPLAAGLKADKDNYKLRYDELMITHNQLVDEYNRLVHKSNSLIDRLKMLEKSESLIKFSSDDFRKLLLLCHPDKHGGKTIAHEVTQKLLAMRKFA